MNALRITASLAVSASLLAGVAQAELPFVAVDGEDNGAEAALRNFKSDVPWSWGLRGFRDSRGSFLYFADHRTGGMLLTQQGDGAWADVTVDSHARGPRENRPLAFDANNDGFIDILHTGDESSDAQHYISNPDGTWSLTPGPYLGRGDVQDVNGDGYLDVVATRRSYGVTTEDIYLNNLGEGFTKSSSPLVRPLGLPESVSARLDALEDDRSSVSNRFSGPTFWEGDLDGDGDSDVVVSYGGSYGGGGTRFTQVLHRNASGDLVEAEVGVPMSGSTALLPPEDLNGDGALDLLLQFGDGAGLYLQDSAGNMSVADLGDRFEQTLSTGPYLFERWSDDFDSDGDPDLLISTQRLGTAFLFENVSGALTLDRTLGHADGEPVTVFDIEGDGDRDIVVWGSGSSLGWPSNQTTRDVTFYMNEAIVTPEPGAAILALLGSATLCLTRRRS